MSTHRALASPVYTMTAKSLSTGGEIRYKTHAVASSNTTPVWIATKNQTVPTLEQPSPFVVTLYN